MSLLLSAKHLHVFFGVRTLFQIDSLSIYDYDRIGLVGENGAGKSTLLSVLYGDRAPDEGVIQRFAQAAVVRQFGEAERIDRIDMDGSIQARLHAKTAVHEGMSGGEMERLRIAHALSTRAPLLFADEPTTNLDFEGIAQARESLAGHPGALLLISHDRRLLDELCTTIWELEDGKLHIFPGNYRQYKAQKALDAAYQQFEYDQYRSEQAKLRTSIANLSQASGNIKKAPSRMGNSEARLHKRGKGASAKKSLDKAAASLQSRLDQLDVKERPRKEAQIKMGLQSHQGIRSAFALRAEHLSLDAGGRMLLADASFDIPTGKRTVLVGANGAGKTTLLRAIYHQQAGVRMSPGVKFGWFGQETLDTLSPHQTLLENVMETSVLTVHETRTLLARVGLKAADMEKPAAILSGGERAKAVLVRLMAGDATVLLMDEPANHLDLYALEALEQMLCAYEGTLLLVSHDRHMIDSIAQRLLLFENGTLLTHEGNLSSYEERKARSKESDQQMEEDILRMRMSALAARMSAPQKGDRPETLLAQFDMLAAQLRALQQK